MRRAFPIVFMFLISFSGEAQTLTVHGRVSSHEDGSGLSGVNVLVQGTKLGTTTNESGEYTLEVPRGSKTIVFTLVGYKRETRSIPTPSAGERLQLDVLLMPAAIPTDAVIVTASKREQVLQDSPVSIALLDASDISRRNSITLDEALRYVPGVNLTESQVNIRGSSGYSRGAGSRVLLLVDGIPLLTGDTQELNFETLPVGQVERVEVLKGASSALYGSSALGGVINVITRPIPDEEQIRIRSYGGVYGSPSFPQWDWKGGTRFLDGQSVVYGRSFGGFGLSLHAARSADDGFRQNDYRRRYNGQIKLQSSLTPTSSLVTTFNILHQRRGSFLYWKDLRNALIPPDVQQGDFVRSTRWYLSSSYSAVVDGSSIVNVRGVWYRNRFVDRISGIPDVSTSHVLDGEAQWVWTSSSSNVVTGGVEVRHDIVRSSLFGARSGIDAAVYAQGEVDLLKEISLTVGMRYDMSRLDSLERAHQVSPRIALVYKMSPATRVRASAGMGFRSPSVAEAFVSTSAGGFPIVPNPSLTSERSLSAELGVNQILGSATMVDMALFHADYYDLIEAGFNEQGDGQFRNVTRARVQGGEIAAKIGLFERAWMIDMGYTYVSPIDRTTGEALKYRPRHVLHFSSLVRAGSWTIGVDTRYLSRVERIDEEFVNPALPIIRDGDQRVAIIVTDLRFGIEMEVSDQPLTASVNINNLFHYNYVELIGNLAPPRHFVLTLETQL